MYSYNKFNKDHIDFPLTRIFIIFYYYSVQNFQYFSLMVIVLYMKMRTDKVKREYNIPYISKV